MCVRGVPPVDSASVLLTITVWAGRARVVLLSGAMMKPSAVVCPGLPGKSQFKRVAELLLADAGRHAGIAHYGFAARLEFRKAARSPRTPAVRSDRRGLPSASSSRSWVMPHAKFRACDAGRVFEVQRPCPLPRDSARISRADCNSHCSRDGDITSAESRTASEGTDDQREHW